MEVLAVVRSPPSSNGRKSEVQQSNKDKLLNIGVHQNGATETAASGKPPLPLKDRSIEGLQRGSSKALSFLRRTDGTGVLGDEQAEVRSDTAAAAAVTAAAGNGSSRIRPAPAVKDAEMSEEEWESESEEVEWVFPGDKLGYGVDDRDMGTADNWVRRHPELVRLTGRHPFNCEPPLSRLMDAGFLTPVSLHYVRNHGYVPRITDGDAWTVQVQGVAFTVAQLKREFRPRTLPVTLVCAGNRRKEENMVKQTIGFNWGAAGVSTSVWKGARLCNVLRRLGVKSSRRRGAAYVCFEGAEKLPGGGAQGGSTYGTSLRIEVAMNEANDILLAYEQNGKELEADHGYPIRLIIPGHIGGRMVKWLAKIWVTASESDNYYHYKDNRVLPVHVDADKANEEGWWYKPEFIINELNINSAITSPAHGEVLPITFTSVVSPYVCRGYAYSGGGRKVIRVEVSLDGGATWRNAELTHPEKPTRYGKCWCWCFWEIEVEVMDLLSAKDLLVRAWDEAMNTQPQQLTWNVMGMMNNCWFKVKVHPCKPPKLGGLGLTFEHPTRPGNQTGGWMEEVHAEMRDKEKPAKINGMSKSASSPFLNQQQHKRLITPSELRKHSTEDSPWILVHNKVYDCTKFLEDHPGGRDSILINAGTDCTEEFDAIHSTRAKDMLETYYIGDLALVAGSISVDATPDTSLRGGSALLHLAPIVEKPAAGTSPPVALNPKQRIPFRLAHKESLSHDVRRLRFALHTPRHVLGLPVGKHVFLSAVINGKLVMRAYTPTSSDADPPGFFELVVKVYTPALPRFPQGGLMSQHLDSLQIGDPIDVKGPLGHLHYLGRGAFTSNGKPRNASRISLLAGGTGITPVYQIIKAVLRDPQDNTQLSLIYANRTHDDILLRDELDQWQQEHAEGRLRVWYTLQEAPPGWAFDVGFMTETMFRQHLFPAAPDTVTFMCGPPPMLDFCCHPFLEKMGYSKDNCFMF